MRTTSALLEIGGGIFTVLGVLHAIYTFLDIRKPRRLVPDDPAVAAAMVRSHLRLTRGRTTMWQAWVGFNFSHSLGVVMFGALCIATGTVITPVASSGWVLVLLPAIGSLYLVIAATYWFRIPIAGSAIATACLFAAWLTYVAPAAN